ncbi:hypothetical protein [Prescottella agglutinans]|uniref:DUF222 domain-containing protein n=1 Tax=Prescottella agglutinans TaxID=1644129 RepID=A0ABT6MJW9_9NOCA|nr:hypothetical protein [Prescottella agglutinans]MDH6284614.1 hypothetical protein [Prescottella agglutinans]
METVVRESAQEQAAAIEALRGAYVRESDERGRLAAAVAVTGAALVRARDMDVPWRQCQLALGGINRAAANLRWKTARERPAGDGVDSSPGVLSELAARWGGERPLRELQALEVAAECGARTAGDVERATCEAEPGRRDYEIDDLVGRTVEDAAESGRLALARASRDGVVPTLEAWRIVSEAAAGFRPLWRTGDDRG